MVFNFIRVSSFILLHANIQFSQHHLLERLSFFHCVFLASLSKISRPHERGPKYPRNLLIKNCVFILTCLNLSHLQSTLQLMQYTCWDIFSTAQNSFWTCWIWCLLVLLPFFVSAVPHWQNVSLWRHFSARATKNVTWGDIR